MNRPAFQAGDVVLVASDNWIGRSIREMTEYGDEGDSVVNHAGLMISEDTMAESLALVRKTNIQDYLTGKDGVFVFRWMKLTRYERSMLAGWAMAQLGDFYAPIKIVLHAADWLINRPFRTRARIFRRLLFLRKRNVCSGLVANVFMDLFKYQFLGLSPEEVTPDDIWDHVTSSQDWELIYCKEANNGLRS